MTRQSLIPPSTFVVLCLLMGVPGAAADETDVLGVARVDAGPSDGQPHFSPPPWDPHGVEGNASSAPANASLDANVYCQQDLDGPDADGDYPWDGAACWTFVGGSIAGVPVHGMFVCAATWREPNSTAYDWIPCVAVLQVHESALVAVAYCWGPYPGGQLTDSPTCLVGGGIGPASHEEGQYPRLDTVAGGIASYDAGTLCIHRLNETATAVLVCTDGSFCPAYNPQALTNACVGPSSTNVTRPDARPTVNTGPGVCFIGDICAPVGPGDPPVDPGTGTREETVPLLAGYVEATAACAAAPDTCRADVPPA